MFSCFSKVLDDVSQLLAPAYHRVAASVMLRDCIQQDYIHGIQKLAVLMVMLKPNLLEKCFTTTLMHRLPQFSDSQDSIPNMQTHQIHSEVDLSACSLSHPAVCTCLDRSLLVHKSQHGLLYLCLLRNFH